MKRISCLILLLPLYLAGQEINIIPKPVEMKIGNGSFILNNSTFIIANKADTKEADYLNSYLEKFYKLDLKIKNINPFGDQAKNCIILLGRIYPEGHGAGYYRFNVDKEQIYIGGVDGPGLFYGMQTLIQLLPIPNTNSKIQIPCVTITDYPRFSYRGIHLDVSRHFFPIDYIKKFIDLLALHKMNYFHWHLTDDQGWRIEIKKYPKLTQIGAWRDGTIIGKYPGTGNDSIHYGGFYTQEQIKEIVKYAAERYITVIPEIDMPGHDMAALAAYPQLGTRPDSVYKVAQTWGIFGKMNNVLAPSEFTFQFIQDVLDEVMDLFPSKYIHIGGDEVFKKWWQDCSSCQQFMKEQGLKDEHELQSYFIKRIEKYVNSNGRTIIGWDEILEGGLAPNAAVMSWRGEKGGIDAAKQNHFVVMTPNETLYFNRSQMEHDDSLTANGYIPIEKVYNYEPVPKELDSIQAKYILGAEGCLWSEYIANTMKLEYQLFPRIAALSEVVWSNKENRNWDDFKKRMITQFKRYDLWKVNYSKTHF